MVAMGLLGVVSLGLIHVTKNTAVSSKIGETATEINILSNLITQILLDKTGCQNTLIPGGTGVLVQNGETISAIVRKNGQPLDLSNNNLVQIDSITLTDVVAPTPPGVMAQAQLSVLFRKKSKLLKGSLTVLKKFPLEIEVNSANRAVACYSAVSNAIQTSKTESCQSLGGIFDPVAQTCTLPTHTHGDYVAKAGDTMTGVLTVNDKIKANEFCVGTNCQTHTASACPAGQVVKKIKADGTAECTSITCPSNQYFEGLDNTGTKICKALPTGTCPTNEFVSEVKPDGTVVCKIVPANANAICSAGQYIESISAGVPVCKSLPGSLAGNSCPGGQYVSGINADGTLACGTAAGGDAITMTAAGIAHGSSEPYPAGWNCVAPKLSGVTFTTSGAGTPTSPQVDIQISGGGGGSGFKCPPGYGLDMLLGSGVPYQQTATGFIVPLGHSLSDQWTFACCK